MRSLVHAPKPLSRNGVLRSAFLVPGMVLLGTACGDAPEASPRDGTRGAPSQPRHSIVEVAQVAGQFSTLLAAVDAAGLTETLEGDGPFTVFAPTDGAFANLPEGALESLLDDPEALSRILLHHVLSGRLTTGEIRERSELETVQGGTLRVDSTPRGVTIDDTYLLTADVPASNGIIHVITSVLLPDPE